MLHLDQEVIPYVVTIGPKLENEISQEKNLLHSFLMDSIGNYAVRKACAYLKSFAVKRLGSGQGSVSGFSPGTGGGELFGIEEQKSLFRMLDPAVALIGVCLTSSLMMIPQKSESGVFATTRQEYVACAYCPRARCDSRSAPYVGEYKQIKHL
jgi:hypothetical protein